MNISTELTMPNDLTISNECRICFETQTLDNIFVHPCACNGTSKYVHVKCLQKWRNTTTNLIAKKRCMECHVFYKIVKEYPNEKHMCKCDKYTYPIIIIFGGLILIISYVTFLFEVIFNNYYYSTLIITFTNKQNDEYNILLINNPITVITYYSSITQFNINVCLSIFYFYNLYFNICRKKHYIKKTLLYTLFNNVWMFYPQAIYYYYSNDFQSFIDYATLGNVLTIFFWFFFFYKEKKIIKYMNTKLNNQIIKNYEDNDII